MIAKVNRTYNNLIDHFGAKTIPFSNLVQRAGSKKLEHPTQTT